MEPNEQLITDFYGAFARKDAAGMAACYADDVVFSDPAFGTLRGDRARGMWAMLCERGKDLTIEVSEVWAEGERGGAHWDARYTFSGTGKPVFNRIDATFEFRDGKIAEHIDVFDFKAWAGQALGLPGKLLGGTGFMQRKVRDQANKQLDSYLAKN